MTRDRAKPGSCSRQGSSTVRAAVQDCGLHEAEFMSPPAMLSTSFLMSPRSPWQAIAMRSVTALEGSMWLSVKAAGPLTKARSSSSAWTATREQVSLSSWPKPAKLRCSCCCALWDQGSLLASLFAFLALTRAQNQVAVSSCLTLGCSVGSRCLHKRCKDVPALSGALAAAGVRGMESRATPCWLSGDLFPARLDPCTKWICIRLCSDLGKAFKLASSSPGGDVPALSLCSGWANRPPETGR